MKFKFSLIIVLFISFIKISIAQEEFVNCDSIYNHLNNMRGKFKTVMLFTSAPEIVNSSAELKKILEIDLNKKEKYKKIIYVAVLIDTNGVIHCSRFIRGINENENEIKRIIVNRLQKITFKPALMNSKKVFGDYILHFRIRY